ncbi:MAG: (2Fe-2S)-binding protein [Aestuariivirga sp.]
MFERLTEPGGEGVRILVEGKPVLARRGDTVTAALIASGLEFTRETVVSGAKRGPYCMMGVCFDCLVTVNGMGNRQGCLVPVEEGMEITLQRGKREFGQ